MEIREILILLGAIAGMVGAAFLLFLVLRRPGLRVEVLQGVGMRRAGPRLCYHLNLRLTALGSPCTLQRVKLSHPRVPNNILFVNYAMGQLVTEDLLGLDDEEFTARTKHTLEPMNPEQLPSIRLPGMQLRRGKKQELTLVGHIPFLLSNKQRELIPIEGWELEFKTSVGETVVEVFEPYGA